MCSAPSGCVGAPSCVCELNTGPGLGPLPCRRAEFKVLHGLSDKRPEKAGCHEEVLFVVFFFSSVEEVGTLNVHM